MRPTKREHYSRLRIDELLEKSREEHIIEARRQTIERLRLTEWKIWKLLNIYWK